MTPQEVMARALDGVGSPASLRAAAEMIAALEAAGFLVVRVVKHERQPFEIEDAP